MFIVISFITIILFGLGFFTISYFADFNLLGTILFTFLGTFIGWVVSIMILIFSFKHYGPIYKKKYEPTDPKLWKFMNAGSRYVIFWLGIFVKVEGLEKLEVGKNYCFYSNHQSFLDILIFDKVLKDFPRGSLYKKEHDNNPFIGPIASALGGVPVDREHATSAVEAYDKATEIINNGESFMIYPEGTRSRGHRIGKYHPSCFRIVQNTNADLVVIAQNGSYKFSRFITIIPTPVHIKIVDVIPNAEVKKYSPVELCNKVREMTLEAFNNL